MSDKRIKNTRLKISALLTASVLISVGSALCLSPEMFQRSGAILTMASAWSFLWVEQLKGMTELGGAFSEPGEFIAIRELWRKQAVVMAYFCVVLGAIGTIIWGYGDLIVSSL